MKQFKFSFILIAVFMATLFGATTALAQQDHSFVSIKGDDNSPCDSAKPCRSFSAAQVQTNAGGDITALDSGVYKGIKINNSLTIQGAPGVSAAIDAGAGENSVLVDTGSKDVVVIRNLSLVTNAGGENGILINASGTVHVEGCVITGFIGPKSMGIYAFGSARLFLKDTVVRNNSCGLFLRGVATIDHCWFEDNGGFGVGVSLYARVTITDSVVSGNGYGLALDFAENSELNIERCVVSNNLGSGIQVNALKNPGGTVRVSNSTITDNGEYGFYNYGGTFESRGNNTVRGHTYNTAGTITIIPGM